MNRSDEANVLCTCVPHVRIWAKAIRNANIYDMIAEQRQTTMAVRFQWHKQQTSCNDSINGLLHTNVESDQYLHTQHASLVSGRFYR